MAMGSLFVGIGYIITNSLKRKVKYILYSIVLMFLFCALVYGHTYNGYFSDSNRLLNWFNIFSAHKEAFSFFGNGPGYLERIAHTSIVSGEIFYPAHNEFLTLLLQYGLFGVSVMAYFLKSSMQKFIKGDVYIMACFLAFLFNMLGSFPLHISSLALIFIINTNLILKGE